MNDRRTFIKNASIGSAGLITAPLLGQSALKNLTPEQIPENLTILFQGDSITDAGRNRSRYYANEGGGMGNGYVYQIASEMLGMNPGNKFRFYNRGISGNKVFQLAERWEDDCLQLKPDVLSILIGVNDFWHTLSSGYEGTAESFDTDLRQLLDRTIKALPGIKLIIGEPFAVEGGTAIHSGWYPEFPRYQKAAKNIAEEHGALFIPYQEIFNDALKKAPVDYWCPDGVHPSIAGGYLMKKAWLDAFFRLY
jgi:lysophospholipase L1-like esterase